MVVILFFHSVVNEHIVDSKMTRVVSHIIGTAVAEMAQYITVIQASHRNLTDDHFLESRESAEDTFKNV